MEKKFSVDGKKLEALMLKLSLSQNGLAKAAGVDKNTVGRMLEGKPVLLESFGMVKKAIEKRCQAQGIAPPKNLSTFDNSESTSDISDDDGGGIGVKVQVRVIEYELTVPIDGAKMTAEELEKIRRCMSVIVQEDISIKRIKFSSVKLYFDLRMEQAQVLEEAIARGELEEVALGCVLKPSQDMISDLLQEMEAIIVEQKDYLETQLRHPLRRKRRHFRNVLLLLWHEALITMPLLFMKLQGEVASVFVRIGYGAAGILMLITWIVVGYDYRRRRDDAPKRIVQPLPTQRRKRRRERKRNQ